MDRQIVYIGQIPLDTDMLSTNKDAYIGLAKLAAALLGINQLLNAFTCTPTSPASMQVLVTPGEIYSLQVIDSSAYGSLGTDTSHSIVKQGVVLNNTTLTLTAPGTGGNSWNYLIQIGFSETDGGSTVLPYYNASDPSQAWSGPNNSGVAENTIRLDGVTIQAKQGVQAPTGTQVTPSPDSGFSGAFVVTVANGQTTIVSGNISTYSTSNFINETLTQKISQATADLRYAQITSVQNNQYSYCVDTSVSANTVTATLSPAITSYVAGQAFYVKIAVTNTGASTIALNGLTAKSILLTNGGAIAAGDLVAGGIAILAYDGTNFQIRNPATADFSPVSIQNNSFIYGNDTGSANAYAVAPTPAVASYAAGLGLIVKISNANTTASTLNVSSLGTKNIKLTSGSSISANDLLSGMEAWFVYDGTNFQLMNPATALNFPTNIQNNSYVYAASSTSPNTYTASISPTPSSYTTGMGVYIKFTNANTSTTPTINLNSLGAKTMTKKDGSALLVGDIASGMIAHLLYDGTNFQLNAVNESNYLTTANYQNNTPAYVVDSGAVNAYVATLSPAITAYTAGLHIDLKISNTNTGSSTLNVNGLGTKTIVNNDSSILSPGDLSSGMVARLNYDGTNFQLMSRSIQQGFNRDFIIGGNFDTNPWQRGTTFTSVGDNVYTADQFFPIKVSTAVFDITKATDAPTVSQANFYSTSSYKLTLTTADTSIASTDYTVIQQRILGYDWAELAQRPFTLSFWVKSSVTGTYCCHFSNSNTSPDRCYVAEYTISQVNTWEKKTIIVTASPSAGDWNYTTGRGLTVGWTLAAGSSFQTTANAWNTGNFLGTSNQVNFLNTNGSTFQLQLIKMEPGNIATSYAGRSIEDELKLCQYYYRKTWAQGTSPATNGLNGATVWFSGAVTNTSTFITERFPAMRTTPTVVVYSSNNSATGNIYDNNGAANLAVTVPLLNDNSFTIGNNSGGTFTAARSLSWHYTLDASL